MDAAYVPNNPQFGQEWDATLGAATDDPIMGSFALGPLDFDPIGNIFSGIGNFPSGHKDLNLYKEPKSPTVEVGDMFFSMKGGATPPPYSTAPPPVMTCPASPNATCYSSPQLLSPGAGGFTQYGEVYSGGGGAMQSNMGVVGPPTPPPHMGPMFPSMSVNVSMNMTMGMSPSLPPCYEVGNGGVQQQFHFSPTGASNTIPTTGYTQQSGTPLGTPLHNSYSTTSQPGYATYSFTADFRPNDPPTSTSPVPKDYDHELAFKPVRTGSAFSPQSVNYSLGSSSLSKNKVFGKCPSQGGILLSEQELSSLKANLCGICGKTYARPSTLKTHMRTHSGERPFRCIDCNKSFSQAANLTAHVRTHSGEKPFRCLICDRRFSQSSSVTTHMRTHSGERPYRCRLCKKAFSDSSTLTKHLRIHSGEKPYQCKLCLLRFSQSGNLNRHMRVHTMAS